MPLFNALASTALYTGLVLTGAGVLVSIMPVSRFWRQTRRRGFALAGSGLVAVAAALALPSPESRAARVDSRLDEFVPVWQFREVHAMRIAAPPDRVFDAIVRVRADEILFFNTLIRIRAGGRGPSESIRRASADFDSLLDIATHTTFKWLANDPPHELVVGTIIERGTTFAAMNFSVAPDGPDASVVTTETRVFSNTNAARRRFAIYWRVIYPGSALIRRMWLRAIERRATSPQTS